MNISLLLFSALVLNNCNAIAFTAMKPAIDISTLEEKYGSAHKFAAGVMEFFKHAFNREYSGIEELKALQNVMNNLFKIHQHNLKYESGLSTFEMALNDFSDWDPSSLKVLRGFKPALQKDNKAALDWKKILDMDAELPESFDWREAGHVSSVKNQGHCGSCWAFSSAGAIEGAYSIKMSKLLDLSEQQLVDCSSSFGNQGCNGGLMSNAFQYVHDISGITVNGTYPYLSGEHPDLYYSCHDEVKGETKVKLSGFIELPQHDEDALLRAVARHGPVSVAIDASRESFHSYSHGIYHDDDCSPDQLDHAVLVVGYGRNETTGLDYWIVKNSWGPWGESGYFKMLRGQNMCGIASMAVLPILDPSN